MDTLLGKGIYPVSDAARIIRATGIRSARTPALRRWTLGYNYQYKGDSLFAEPLLAHGAYEIDGDFYLSFRQLIEARVIGSFRDKGLSPQTIRIYAAILAEEYAIDNPLALRRLWTDGKKIYTDLVPKRLKEIMPDKQATHEIISGQYAFDIIHDFFIRNIEYSDEGAERLWPLGRDGGIVIDPQRSFGRPIDTISGVSSYVLYSLRKAGTSEDAIANWYGVTPLAVRASYDFETRMAMAA